MNGSMYPSSPCNNDCMIDAVTGYCQGCWRDLDEIANWGMMDEEEKLRVLDAVAERRRQHGAES